MSVPLSPASICSKIFGNVNAQLIPQVPKWKPIPRYPGFSGWLEHVYKGSNKVRFEYCETSQKALTYIHAIQGHSGGIATDFMGHVLLPKG